MLRMRSLSSPTRGTTNKTAKHEMIRVFIKSLIAGMWSLISCRLWIVDRGSSILDCIQQSQIHDQQRFTNQRSTNQECDLVQRRAQMLAQQIATEVAAEITPHRVHVVGVVLSVVELDQKCRPLH